MMEMIYILIWVNIIEVYALVKTHQTISLRSVHFTIDKYILIKYIYMLYYIEKITHFI